MASLKGRTFPPEPLSLSEVRALLAVLPPTSPTRTRNRALVILLWRSGVRCREALDLRVSDVDLEAGTVRVLRGKGKRARTVGIDPEACAEIGAWVALRAVYGGGRGGPLFCSVRPPAGESLATRQVRHMMERLGREAGIGHRTHAHGLRHTMAVELSREGWSVSLIQRQLGHSSVAVTSLYLDHLSPQEVIDAARGRKWAG